MKMTGLLILSILGVASAQFAPAQHYVPIQPGHGGTSPVVQPGHGGQSGQGGTSPVQGSDTIFTARYAVNGVVTFDNHACVFQNGEIEMIGPYLLIGQNASYKVSSGFAIIETGERVQINNGLIHVTSLSISNVQAIRSVLAQAGMTYNQFIQRTGTISTQQGVFHMTAGVMGINGVLRNLNVGLLVVVEALEFPGLQTGTSGTLPATGNTGNTQTIFVTETAAHETRTISQTVAITKTATQDIFITITSPIYNSINAVATNFVKETVTVQEEQVIRSPLPGRVIVNTIPVEAKVTLTVTNTATQFFVQTAVDTITHTLNHLAPNYNFRTVTINKPQTSTVVQIISQTSVTTAFITSTLARTLYETSTVYSTVVGTTEPAGYY